MQLFVGVWPSKKAMQALADYPKPDDVDGWVGPEQWLVNVRPLGHVGPELVPRLVEVLSFELDGMPKPTAKLRAPNHGSWLWIPVEGLEELRDVVFEATIPLIPVTHPKSLPWTPALPLRKDRSPKDLVHPIAGSWRVGEVVLAKGRRTRDGHGYETVETISL